MAPRMRRSTIRGCRNLSVAFASKAAPMLKIENLSVSIGPIPIIRNASLQVDEGQMCGLIGRNGAGKTTLLRALMGGTRILLLDEPFEGLAPALARRLGEVLANLKTEGVSVLIAESNELHVLDLLARAFTIERGAVSEKK